MDAAQVNEIAAVSAQANAQRDVTGALAYNGRNFCQVLEGEDAVVRNLIAKIEQDPRHSGFKIIDKKSVDHRHFAEWSMKLVSDLDFSTVINAMNA
ncbi:BLUF [Roseobacter sp. CCS2]|nr:BLUF [Roseobacter sp. CCS2]